MCRRLLLAALLLPASCCPKVIVRTQTVYRDSLVLRTDTVLVQVPKEIIVSALPQLDTSFLETSLAVSKAWLDSSALLLRHTLANKDTALRAEVLVKDRVISRDSIVYRDREVPVEKVVKAAPKSYWWLLGWAALSLGLLAVRLALKLGK